MSSCRGKIKHKSASSAHLARQRMADEGKAVGSLSAYCCEHCGFWHLGNGYQSDELLRANLDRIRHDFACYGSAAFLVKDDGTLEVLDLKDVQTSPDSP